MSTLLIMAAGLGSRYGGLKQIDRVGPSGEMLLDYAVFDARRAGFQRVVFVIRDELTETFTDLTRHLPADLDISCVRQDTARVPSWFDASRRSAPWGTVHAVLAASDVVHSPFATINADDFYGRAAYRIAIEECERPRADATYTVIGLPLSSTLSHYGPVVRAICHIGSDGWIDDIEEVSGIRPSDGLLEGTSARGRRFLTSGELASMNFWVFTPDVFSHLQERFDEFLRSCGTDPVAESLLPQAIGDLIHRGTAHVRPIQAPGPWFGLTHADDRPKVIAGLRELHERAEYPTPLWSH